MTDQPLVLPHVKRRQLTQYTSPTTLATRDKPARPPGTMHTFSCVYWLAFPFLYVSLYKFATAARRSARYTIQYTIT